jgi:GTPase SAR1 family protein
LVGDANVGKSSLISKYFRGDFVENLIGTAGIDQVEKNIEH